MNRPASGAYQNAAEVDMIDGLSIEGYAIVSRNGMLAGADGLMPNSLKFDEDQHFLDEEMDKAALLIHGRKSHEGQDNSHKRRRLLLSRSGGPFSTIPVAQNTWAWNPQATSLPDVCKVLGVDVGVVAILGGTAAYDMLLPAYTKFHLAWAGLVELPGGVPVFGAVRESHPPEAVLEKAGLKFGEETLLNAGQRLRRLTFVRT